jgi:hypothetical protein
MDVNRADGKSKLRANWEKARRLAFFSRISEMSEMMMRDEH